ncbi:MAG: FHA domain-containing protein [Deltaproteobacteria bacterium]|nr:FHA domain-containing protein [Deltaproteobacteria bacterium]
MICNVCGSENPDRLTFCATCGDRLRTGQAPAVPAAPPAGTPEPQVARAEAPAVPAASPSEPAHEEAKPPAGTASGGAPEPSHSRPSAPPLRLSKRGRRRFHQQAEAPSELERDEPGPEDRGASPGGARVEEPREAGRVCSSCGARSPAHYRFCLGCGSGLDEPAAPPEPRVPEPAGRKEPGGEAPGEDADRLVPRRVVAIEPEPAAERAAIACPRCHGACDAGERFCKYCGAPLERVAQASEEQAARGTLDGGLERPAWDGPGPEPKARRAEVPERERRVTDRPPPRAAAAEQEAEPEEREAQERALAQDEAPATGSLVIIVEDGSEGRSLPLRGDQVDLGSAEGDIVLGEDAYLSPRHARFYRRDGTWHLRDLDSTNGAYMRLREPEPLRHGDFVLLGLEVLVFELLPHEGEGLGPAREHGTLVFGSPATPRRARLCQRTVEGIARDVYHLVKDETIIGREVGDIVFTSDPFMSRRHAAIRWQESMQQYVLEDLTSSNGTYLAIRDDVPLHDGDFVRLGQHLFRVDLP